MMTHLMSNLLETYRNIVENIEDKLDDEGDPLTSERINEELAEKYYRIRLRPETKIPNKEEKSIYTKSQYKGTCTNCGKYGHKSQYLWHKED